MRWQRYLGLGLATSVLITCAAPSDRAAPSAGAPAPGASQPAPRAEAAAPSAPAAPARPVEKITYALAAASGVFVPPNLSRDKGFFREEGLEVDLPVMRSNLLSPGMAAGEVDYAGSFSPSVRNALSGMPIRVIAATVNKATRQLFVVPSIQNVQQLRGQTIAVSTIGDGPYNSTVLALEHFGIDGLTEITWIGAGGTMERLLAMQQGGAVATIVSGPEVPRAQTYGFTSLIHMNDVAPLPESGVATTAAKLESNRDQVKRVLRAIIRGLQYLKTDREGSIPSFMGFLQIDREEAEQAYDGIAAAYSEDGTLSDRSMRFTIEAEKKQLKLTEDVPFSRVADFAPLYEVLREQGITPTPDSAR
jgi:ABC-type nitrate/sulfonate/bicarbonate transport system substrate-binding protein